MCKNYPIFRVMLFNEDAQSCRFLCIACHDKEEAKRVAKQKKRDCEFIMDVVFVDEIHFCVNDSEVVLYQEASN